MPHHRRPPPPRSRSLLGVLAYAGTGLLATGLAACSVIGSPTAPRSLSHPTELSPSSLNGAPMDTSTPAQALHAATSENSGIPEVSVAWAASQANAYRWIDVREVDEVTRPRSFVEGMEHVPMGDLMTRAASWNRDEPLLVFCRSGARSGRAAVALRRAGFTHVASVQGGMLRWDQLGLPLTLERVALAAARSIDEVTP